MLIKNSVKYNIDLNTKNKEGNTALHLAISIYPSIYPYNEQKLPTIETILNNAESFKIDLTGKATLNFKILPFFVDEGSFKFQWGRANDCSKILIVTRSFPH